MTSVMVAVAVVLVAAGVVAVLVVRSRLVDRVDTELQATADSVTSLVTPEQLNEFSSDDSLGANSQATIVIGVDGATIATLPAGSPGDRLPLPDLTSFTVADLTARAGTPFTRSAEGDSDVSYRVLVERIGAEGDLVAVATPLSDVHETVGLLALILTTSTVLVLAVLGGLIWLFSRATIKPIDDMIMVAGAIGRGDLTARIDADSTNAEVVRLSDALNAMLGQLEAAFVAKEATESRLRRFVADASHELRTPLTTIQGWADLYEAGEADRASMAPRAMDRISSEAQRMAVLVEDLLLLARLDQHHDLLRQRVDLGPILVDSVADLRASQPGRTVHFTAPAEPVPVLGDEARLRQVVANLLANARIHTPPETEISVELSATADEVVLTVTDDGPGLAAADAAHVFDRFYRTEASRDRSTGGSGLGLSIVRSVVEAHGGTIELTTAPAQGAVFSIHLPTPAR